MTDVKYCKEIISVDGWHRSRCPNRAKYGDKCGVHAPEKIAERAAKRGLTQWERGFAVRAREREERELLERLVTAARAYMAEKDSPVRDPGLLHGKLTRDLRDALAALDAHRGKP